VVILFAFFLHFVVLFICNAECFKNELNSDNADNLKSCTGWPKMGTFLYAL